ncbi:MAG: polysaccharide deacetylase family protein [Candidatus Gracilibacteria bacterium]
MNFFKKSAATLALMAGFTADQPKPIPEPTEHRLIDETSSETRSQLPLRAFGFHHERSKDKSEESRIEWPSSVPHPLSSVQPTFDDGPHRNDRLIAEKLKELPFKNPIFYYVGERFFKSGTVYSESDLLENEDHLRKILDPEMCAIAKEMIDHGYEIGYHGMTHSQPESPKHMQSQDKEDFERDLQLFEKIMQIATGKLDFHVKHIRPPYGAGTSDIIERPFMKYAQEHGIEARTWSIASFDWDVKEARSERILADALQVVMEGKSSDILFHSQHQDGTALGNFGQMCEEFKRIILSINAPGRVSEKANYKKLIEAIVDKTPISDDLKLQNSHFRIGSPGQIAIDSAYNTDLSVQYMGAVQFAIRKAQQNKEKSPIRADGYISASTAQAVITLYPEAVKDVTTQQIAHVLRDPSSLENSDIGKRLPDLTFPNRKDLSLKDISFANRGLQVQAIASDIVLHGGIDEAFLANYDFSGLHIDQDHIPTYIRMYAFLQKSGLDDHTSARVVATAMLESGVKNTLDDFGIGKGTAETVGTWMYKHLKDTSIPKHVRGVVPKKVGDTLQNGPKSVGPGQVPLSFMWAMCELITERKLSRDQVEDLLETPEGAALGIYLRMRQDEIALSSEK